MSERKDLPPATASNFLPRVREELAIMMGNRGEPLDQTVRFRDLTDAKIITLRPGFATSGGSNPIGGPGTAVSAADEADLTPPPTPTGLVASAAISNLFVGTDNPLFTVGHGYGRTILYGATRATGAPAPTFSSAVELASFIGPVYAYPTNPATTWHLWVKWRTVDGVLSAAPAGGINGLAVTTGQDVSLLRTALTGQIRESELFSTLGDRINLIDGPSSLIGSVSQRLGAAGGNRLRNSSFEVASPTGGVAKGWFDYSYNETSTVSTVSGRLGGIAARRTWTSSNTSVKGFYTGSELDAASGGGGVIGGWKAGATYMVSFYARSNTTNNAVSGMSLNWNVVPTQVAVANPPLSATVWNRYVFKLTWGTTVEDNGRLFLTIAGGGGQTGYVEIDDVQVQEGDTVTGYSPGDQAELIAAVQTEATARANADGTLFAQYSVKVDVNGYVAGFGLSSTANNAAPTSAFAVRADQFYIASPSGPGVAPAVPFIVRTTATTINGVAVPAGVYMADAFIQNGTITNAKIGNAQIDDAKVANLSVNKLIAGTLSVGTSVSSSNYLSGSRGFYYDYTGYFELQNALVRGTIYAEAGYFKGELVAATGHFTGTLAIGLGGRNMVSNSGPAPGSTASYAQIYSNGTFTGPLTSFSPYFPPGGSGLYITGAGTPSAGQYGSLDNDNFGAGYPVIGGKRYEFSAYLSMHRSTGLVDLLFFDANGVFLGDNVGPPITDNFAQGALGNWFRSGIIATAPATAVKAVLNCRMVNCGANPYLFTSSWYFGEAGINQTGFSPYSPAGQTLISGDMIRTASLSAITADVGLLRTSATGERTEIQANQIRCYDAANTLRVLIGRL